MIDLNGKLEEIDGRPALRFTRALDASPERVWRAVTEPAELERWFVVAPDWTPRAGERFETLGGVGEVVVLDPPNRIEWTFAGERYWFAISPAPGGCRLEFVHVLPDGSIAADRASGWEWHLALLPQHLAGTEIDRNASPGELHERYAIAFGIDPAPGRASLAGGGPLPVTLEPGPVLRIERVYRSPVDRVWRAIDDAEERSRWFPSDAPLEVDVREEPHRLEGTWFGDRLAFALSAEGEGCRLVFTHTFADVDTSARTAAGWDRCFARFEALLAGGEIDERAALEHWPAVHERYAESFGVDAALGREAFADHPLT